MEAVTAFVEGPLCFVILYGMLKQKPWRFTLQFAVSLAQFYGDVLYFATSWYDGRLVFSPFTKQRQFLGPGMFPTLCSSVYLPDLCRATINITHVVVAAAVQRHVT